MKNEITYLGKVINVNSSTVEVEISNEIPSAAPIINGRLYKLGQIGTFVRIPVGGSLVLFGLVSAISNTPLNVKVEEYKPTYGYRFLQIQLIGEKLGDKKFEKGVGTYPTINDEVHIVTEDDLKSIYGDSSEGLIEIGRHSSSENLSVYLDLHNLVLRHSAILGSTGSGKSNTTAIVIKNILNQFPGSRIILVDTHGEYASAFGEAANVFKINDTTNPLYIPFWTMTFDEISFFLVGRSAGQEQPQDKKLRDKILELKKDNAKKLKGGAVNPDYITADSPIPFDIRQLWHDLNREVNATYKEAQQDKQTKDTEELIDAGNPKELRPAQFQAYGMGAVAPYKSKTQEMYTYEKKIYSRLKDSRFDYMFDPGEFYDTAGKDDIEAGGHYEESSGT